jgi:hypothetical protein
MESAAGCPSTESCVRLREGHPARRSDSAGRPLGTATSIPVWRLPARRNGPFGPAPRPAAGRLYRWHPPTRRPRQVKQSGTAIFGSQDPPSPRWDLLSQFSTNTGRRVSSFGGEGASGHQECHTARRTFRSPSYLKRTSSGLPTTAGRTRRSTSSHAAATGAAPASCAASAGPSCPGHYATRPSDSVSPFQPHSSTFRRSSTTPPGINRG